MRRSVAGLVDRAKGVTLQALNSALIGQGMAGSRQALALMQEEEAGGGGAATVLCHGAKLTKAGAAFVNAETIFAGGKWDTFRMLTHPGVAILPAALVAAETTGCSGQEFLTGVAAGYEIMERMAAEFIPTVMSRGLGSWNFMTSAAWFWPPGTVKFKSPVLSLSFLKM